MFQAFLLFLLVNSRFQYVLELSIWLVVILGLCQYELLKREKEFLSFNLFFLLQVETKIFFLFSLVLQDKNSISGFKA